MADKLIFLTLEEALDRINLDALEHSDLSDEQKRAHRDLASIGRKIVVLFHTTVIYVRARE